MNLRTCILAAAAVTSGIAVLFIDVPSSQAQVSNSRNPWCLRDGPMGRGSWDCSYQSRRQCLISSRNDADGFCTPNPNYRGRR
jgi:hypothetical protein